VASDDRVRVEVGFASGALMIASVSVEKADELVARLQARGDDVVALEAEDGAYFVAIPHVTYVKRFSRESRVGFGQS
jgi:hypothetical protein